MVDKQKISIMELKAIFLLNHRLEEIRALEGLAVKAERSEPKASLDSKESRKG